MAKNKFWASFNSWNDCSGFFRKGKNYNPNVENFTIVLGHQKECNDNWISQKLIKNHHPECPVEQSRIYRCGGTVGYGMNGELRVRCKRLTTQPDGAIIVGSRPFLSFARSLGNQQLFICKLLSMLLQCSKCNM